MYSRSYFHISDILLRQFSKDTGPYRWFNTGIIRKMGSSANKMSGAARFFLRSKTSSFSHFQGVIAAPPAEKARALSFIKAALLQHRLASKFHLFHVGRKKSVGRCNFSGRTPAKGLMCHGTSFAETKNSKKKRREMGGAWLLCPFWAPLQLGAMEESPVLCWGFPGS